MIFESSAKPIHYEKTLKFSGKFFIYGKLLRHTNKGLGRFLLCDAYMNHPFLETFRVMSSISTRNFFVTRNKQPMTIGTNRMCICRDYNCANTMCFPRQLPTAARKQLTTIIDDYHCLIRRVWYIRVVLSVSLLVSYFVMNFIIVDGFPIDTNWYESQL